MAQEVVLGQWYRYTNRGGWAAVARLSWPRVLDVFQNLDLEWSNVKYS